VYDEGGVSVHRNSYTFEPHDLHCGQHVMSLDSASPTEPFSEQEISQLSLQRPDVLLEQGEVLFTPDEEGNGELYILKKGRVRLYKMTSPSKFTKRSPRRRWRAQATHYSIL